MNYIYQTLDIQEKIPFSVTIEKVSLEPDRIVDLTEILLILENDLEIIVNGTSKVLHPSDLFLINQNSISYMRSDTGCVLIRLKINFKKYDIPEKDIQKVNFDLDSSKNDGLPYGEIKNILYLIVEKNANSSENTFFENKSLGYSLLKILTENFLSQNQENKISGYTLNRIRELTTYINDNYDKNLSLGDVAKGVSNTPTYISSIFSTYLNTTFLSYYNQVRISHALSIIESDSSFEDVAYKTGFSNAQSFVRAFKSIFGCTPSSYRAISRGKTELSKTTKALISDIVDLNFERDGNISYSKEADIEKSSYSKTISAICGFNNVIETYDRDFGKTIGLGRAKQLMYRTIQEQLTTARREIGFKYIKFHGLLSDDMMVVSKSSSNELVFSFSSIDIIFDFLKSIDMYPIIELSFMPTALASKNTMILTNSFNTSAPSSLSDWLLLIEKLFNHLIKRYGLDYVKEMPVLIWHGPDTMRSMFGMPINTFSELYIETFRLIKNISPLFKIGTPAFTFMNSQSINYITMFCQKIKEAGIIPDFISCNNFHINYIPEYIKVDLRKLGENYITGTDKSVVTDFYATTGIPVSTDPDYLLKFTDSTQKFLDKQLDAHLPYHITEWNISTSHNFYLHDTVFMGCFVVKNMCNLLGHLDSISYWSLSDLIEEQLLPSEIFHGGMGLFTSNGIRKPSYFASMFMHRLKREIIGKGDGYIVTKGDNRISIIMYNYSHYSDSFANNQSHNISLTDRTHVFQDRSNTKISLTISGLDEKAVDSSMEYIVNEEYGSAYDLWIKSGMNNANIDYSTELSEYLKKQSEPFIRILDTQVNKNGEIRLECILKPQEFRLCIIDLKD